MNNLLFDAAMGKYDGENTFTTSTSHGNERATQIHYEGSYSGPPSVTSVSSLQSSASGSRDNSNYTPSTSTFTDNSVQDISTFTALSEYLRMQHS